MATPANLIGNKYGRLTVIEKTEERDWNSVVWLCRCDCGNFKKARTTLLNSGDLTSCGCRHREIKDGFGDYAKKHGCSGLAGKTPEYSTWCHMKSRCQNPRHDRFADYGGRGITVCERWQEFAKFMEDMGPRPKGTTIDRKDNERGYEPGNCRWATAKEQADNRRRKAKE